MDQEKLQNQLKALELIDDEVQQVTGEYNEALEAMGKDYDVKIDELTQRYNQKWEAMTHEIKGVQ